MANQVGNGYLTTTHTAGTWRTWPFIKPSKIKLTHTSCGYQKRLATGVMCTESRYPIQYRIVYRTKNELTVPWNACQYLSFPYFLDTFCISHGFKGSQIIIYIAVKFIMSI